MLFLCICAPLLRFYVGLPPGLKPYTITADTAEPIREPLPNDLCVPDSPLRNVPGIYQEVSKAFELRVTSIGDHLFAAKICSQETQAGKVDWRKAYTELQMQPFMLPDGVASCCQELISRLGLVFGCFDLVVTPAGEIVFLEVNEMGQFLFVEKYTGQYLLDAFSEFLLQGAKSFLWSESAASVRSADVFSAAEAATILSREKQSLGLLVLARYDRVLIAEGLARCQGNMAETCAALGISRNKLRARMRQYGLKGNVAKAR